jgi:hypothetical protein
MIRWLTERPLVNGNAQIKYHGPLIYLCKDGFPETSSGQAVPPGRAEIVLHVAAFLKKCVNRYQVKLSMPRGDCLCGDNER